MKAFQKARKLRQWFKVCDKIAYVGGPSFRRRPWPFVPTFPQLLPPCRNIIHIICNAENSSLHAYFDEEFVYKILQLYSTNETLFGYKIQNTKHLWSQNFISKIFVCLACLLFLFPLPNLWKSPRWARGRARHIMLGAWSTWMSSYGSYPTPSGAVCSALWKK